MQLGVNLQWPGRRACRTQSLHRTQHLAVPRSAHVIGLHPIQHLQLPCGIGQNSPEHRLFHPHAEAVHHSAVVMRVARHGGSACHLSLYTRMTVP